MGFLRKIVSGSAAAATGGLSLGVFQFRSDTERGTRQTKKLRLSQNGQSPNITPDAPQFSNLQWVQDFSNRTVTDTSTNGDSVSKPSQVSPGWKSHPTLPGLEQFWNGSKWTEMIREISK